MKNIYIIIGSIVLLIIIIVVTLYIGKSIGIKSQEDSHTIERIKEIHVDNSLSVQKIEQLESIIKNLSENNKIYSEKEIVIREKANNIILPKPLSKECDTLYTKAVEKITLLEDTLNYKDTIENNLNATIDNYINILNEKDRIILNKDEEIQLTKNLNKSRVKKYSIGLQIGYGYTIKNNNLKSVPYIGIGFSKNLVSF